MQNTSNYQNRFGSSEPALTRGAPDLPSEDSAGRERQRLTALAGYRILDTPPESAYDEIVQLVAVLCATPMAAMTLIDEHRQWFKARVGMAVEETEREISFCTYVVQEGGLLEVRDAYQDPRFADNPLVRGDPWIRFYAGAPLRTSDGFVLGSLAVLDRVPRELTPLQRRGLEVLARQVVSQLELRRSLEYSKTLLSERDAAQADLQDSNAQLERKVRARTEDLHRANRELESQAAHARREAEFSQAVIDSLPGIVYIIDSERCMVRWNKQLERLTGLDAAGVASATVKDFFPDEGDYLLVSRSIEQAMRGDQVDAEAWIRTANGGRAPYFLSGAPIELDGRRYVCGLGMDISARRRTEENLHLRERAIQASVNAIIITGREGEIEYVNPAFERITGYGAAEVQGRTLSFLQGADREQAAVAAMREAVRRCTECVVLVRNYRKDGELFWSDVRIAPVRDPDGTVRHFIGILNDVTALKYYERELERHANVDALTALATRAVLHERLVAAMAAASRNGASVAIGFIDLDNFKFINESLGHNVGDELLKRVAERLAACLGPGDTLARYGGDEFSFVLAGSADQKSVAAVVQRMLQTVDQPLQVGTHQLFISCSIGVSFYPRDGCDVHTLLKNADAAMHVAKDVGRNNVQFYTSSMNRRATERVEMEARLRRALGNDEFVLHYQPKLDLRSGSVVGVEALLRWYPKDAAGAVPPAVFIPLAEETGLISAIGEWVLHTACAHSKAMQQLGMAPMRMAVNLSARQFELRSVVHLVEQALAASGLAAHCLEIELTESTVMRNPGQAVEVLFKLKEMGLRLAIDDFGTGYSSLTYLQRFPVDLLKIDQSFVRNIGTDSSDAIIARAVISLGHSLGMSVIAEGVSSAEQLSFLRENGCDEIQGHLFSPPLPFEQLMLFLRERQAPSSTG